MFTPSNISKANLVDVVCVTPHSLSSSFHELVIVRACYKDVFFIIFFLDRSRTCSRRQNRVSCGFIWFLRIGKPPLRSLSMIRS